MKTNFILTLIALLGVTSSYAQLTHPGGWLTQDELTFIRDKVSAQEEPWYSAWLAMENEDADENYSASVVSTITNQGIFQADGHAAYMLAIKWVASGNQAYATAGIDIINDWVNTVTGFNHGNTPLRQGIASNKMANAAEILAHGFNGGSGWSTSNINSAKTWFKNVVYPVTSTGGSRSMNWGTSCVAGNMSMAIFCDDNTMFNAAIDAYKFGFTDTTDGCAGVTQYIINSDGQCFESERDQGHTQGGIAHLVEPALIAWNQGVDLVSYSNDRLVAGMEYTAEYNLGNNVSWTNNVPNPCNQTHTWMNNGFISEEDRGDFSPIYVMASSLFTRAGKAHPFTAEVISDTGDPNDSNFNGYSQPESFNSDHPGLGTLTHTLGPIVTMRKRNSTGYALDGGNGGANNNDVKLYAQDASNINQQWVEIDRGNGYYSYLKNGTNFCIDGGNGGDNKNNVKLYTRIDTQQNQHWKKISTGSGHYRLQKRNSSSYSIDGNHGGGNNQSVYLYTNSTTNYNQQWLFSSLTSKKSGKKSSVEQLEANLDAFSIYPNPVENELTIEFNDNYSQETSVTLYAINGQKVIETKPNGEEVRLDLSKLNSGIYILKASSKTQNFTKKIVKL
ncbi:MAG: T9SS type A sorting domain-containing protein [Algibacter sp.]